MSRRLLVLCALGAILCGCAGRSGSGSQSAPSARKFPVVQIPSVYTEQVERQEYALMHYWDAFLSTSSIYESDSLTLNGVARSEVEQQMATFVSLAEGADIAVARKACAALFAKVEARQEADTLSGVFNAFASMAEKYFYDPNSPLRDEDLYAEYLKGRAVSRFTEESLRPSLEHTLRMCSLNARGTRAADFRFVDISGRSYTLYGIKAPYTLLFFSNPGCTACKAIIETLSSDLRIQYLISEGHLAVANVYIDEDLAAWRSYQEIYPKEWYNGYDPTYSIRQDLSYNVRAIPSLYLLDGSKNVLLKDAPEERLFAYLRSL